MIKDLGEGSFGLVKLGRDNTNGEFVALKILYYSNPNSKKGVEQFNNEVNVLSMLDNVID